jgi:hypothetical protein
MAKRTKKDIPTPLLDALLADGTVKINDRGEVIGIAADGVEVTLGYTDDFLGGKAKVEEFLVMSPSPTDW